MRPCYVFNATKPDQPASLSIYDEIGFWGVQAKDFRASLSAITQSEIDVEISSPGGDYFAGLAMYNMLRSSGKVINTKVMGVAASAASVIFMAGDKRTMPANTFLMTHNPSNPYGGNAKEHRETADMLDKIAIGARSVYAKASGMTDEAVATMLDTDSWISADEALEMGLATEVTDEIKATAKFDLARADLPSNVVLAFAQAEKPAPETPPETTPEPEVETIEGTTEFTAPPVADQIVQAATQAGLAEHAPVFALACLTMEDARTRIAAALEITALCKAVKRHEDAGPAIKAGKSLADVRASLADAMAQADTHIDTAKKITTQTTTQVEKPPVTSASIWASHLGQK